MGGPSQVQGRWGEDLNFREWRSELGTEEGVPRFLVAILRLQGVFLVCHCLLLRQDLDSQGSGSPRWRSSWGLCDGSGPPSAGSG